MQRRSFVSSAMLTGGALLLSPAALLAGGQSLSNEQDGLLQDYRRELTKHAAGLGIDKELIMGSCKVKKVIQADAQSFTYHSADGWRVTLWREEGRLATKVISL